MSKFEDEIGYVLIRFRNSETNYSEATIEIEELILQVLGFTGAQSKAIDQIEKPYSERIRLLEQKNQALEEVIAGYRKPEIL